MIQAAPLTRVMLRLNSPVHDSATFLNLLLSSQKLPCRNILPRRRRRGHSVTKYRFSQHRDSRNNPGYVKHHNQTKNPRHQHESNEESHRSAQHQGKRYPQHQRSESRRRDLSHRRPTRRLRLLGVRDRSRRRS